MTIHNLRQRMYSLFHQLRFAWLSWGKDDVYKDYLKIQFERTMSKKATPLQSTRLADRLFEHVNIQPHMALLCLGSRNDHELNYLKSKGAASITGIDLYSESPHILVMDMHHLKFPDSQFDVIYSSHSLEHAYDASQVAREIIRVAKNDAHVAIEVPVKYEVRGSDRIDFDSAENLLALFAPHVHQVLLSEEHPPYSEMNRYAHSIVRVIFSIQKHHAS